MKLDILWKERHSCYVNRLTHPKRKKPAAKHEKGEQVEQLFNEQATVRYYIKILHH